MEIPLQAQVECTDGIYGRSVYVLINPVAQQVTHLVVKETSAPHTEYSVPIAAISAKIGTTIHLNCTKAALEKMEPFIQTEFVEEKISDTSFRYSGGSLSVFGAGSYYYLPYVVPEHTVRRPVEERQIPPGELALHRGTRVEATDGFVGHVDEFVVNPANGYITDMVMREGHLWGQKDVIIPVSAMGSTHEETVFLTLDKHQVEALPIFPMQRNWS
jgi:hypothetical protein